MLDTGLGGRTALLTGGASGIGQSIALALATEGVNVRIADIRPADTTVELIRAEGGSASAVEVDVRSEEQLSNAISAAITDLGGIDLFVNVAATYAAQAVTRVESDVWSDALRTNVTACALAARPIAWHMIVRGLGRSS